MGKSFYEIAALVMRYFFAGIMVVIVARAWKITVVDNHRASRLRRYSPETGVCGEFVVLTGDIKVKEGARFTVIREGLIGSSGKADVRLKSRSVRRSHAFFEMTEQGLRVRVWRASKILNKNGDIRREVVLKDGDTLTIGNIELLLVTTVPGDTVSSMFDELGDNPFDWRSGVSQPREDVVKDTGSQAPEDEFSGIWDNPKKKKREDKPYNNDDFFDI